MGCMRITPKKYQRLVETFFVDAFIGKGVAGSCR
jgi:hypothetical protein